MLSVWTAGAVGLVTVLLAAAGSTTIGRRFRADRSAAVGRGAHPQEVLAHELGRQRPQQDMPPAPTELRVVTLNTGLIAVTPLMAERLELLLAGDAGSFITGTEMVVDGGYAAMTI